MSELKTPMSAMIETDEIELSKRYPDTFFVTLIHNGTTVTIPIQNLIAMLVEDVADNRTHRDESPFFVEPTATAMEQQDDADLIIH